jgi:putative peptidoglycan lipid II flippase
VINVILAYVLTGIATGQVSVNNVCGIAAANSIGVAVEVSILLVILRRRWHGIDEQSLAATTLKTIAASLVMGLAVIGVEFAFSVLNLPDRLLYTAAQVGTQIIVGGIVFLIATLMLRMQEVRDLLKMIFRRCQAVKLESIQPVG